MPTIQVNGVELFYKETGSGPETIVFSHGLLMDHAMFEPQRVAFDGRYRVIAYDHRGQGQSSDPGYGHDMDTLTEDVASLIQALKRWETQGSQARLEELTVLRLKNPELMKTLRNSEAKRFLGEPLGLTAVVVKAGAWQKVVNALAEMGYFVDENRSPE